MSRVCLLLVFLPLLLLIPVFSQKHNANSQLDDVREELQRQAQDNRQTNKHLRHLAEDISAIVTYFEMDNSSVAVELTRQVAQLKDEVKDLSRKCGRCGEQKLALRTWPGPVPMPVKLTTIPTTTTTPGPTPSTTPPEPFPEGICGDILKPVRMRDVPDGWVMCYLHVSSQDHLETPCRDLVVNLKADFPTWLIFWLRGGSFGCWHSSGGLAGVEPAAVCQKQYQPTIALGDCPTCDVMAVCIRYPE